MGMINGAGMAVIVNVRRSTSLPGQCLNLRNGSNVTLYMEEITGGHPACLGVRTPTANPSVAGLAVEVPPHPDSQGETIGALTNLAGPEFRRGAPVGGGEKRPSPPPLA